MAKYTAGIAFNVPYYAQIDIEADSDKEAIEKAKKAAREQDGVYSWQPDLVEEHRVVDVIKHIDGMIVIAEGIYV